MTSSLAQRARERIENSAWLSLKDCSVTVISDEQIYEEGQRTWLHLLRLSLRGLGYENHEAQATRWVIERAGAILALRDLCRAFGDNDWPDDLAMCDIIEKHLVRHLSWPSSVKE